MRKPDIMELLQGTFNYNLSSQILIHLGNCDIQLHILGTRIEELQQEQQS